MSRMLKSPAKYVQGKGIMSELDQYLQGMGMGINVRRYKILAFVISAVFASVAGSMYAHFIGFISPETFNSAQSNLQMTMLLFGGMGNPVGPIFGASVIAILNESLQSFSTYKTLIYGVLVLIAVLFMPRGCFGLGQDLVNKIRKRGGKVGKKNAEN